MIEVLESVTMTINRDVSRLRFAPLYWSANKVNFDDREMPQTARGIYEGRVHIVHFPKGVGLKEAYIELADTSRAFCEVVDAFQFGVTHANLVRRHKYICIYGTIGRPSAEAKDAFSPQLFLFGDSSVSFGIDLLTKDKSGNLRIPAGSKSLVYDRL